MKFTKLRIEPIVATVMILGVSAPAIALPLQSGTYSFGSSFAQIAKLGDRVCYQGLSRHGAMVASVSHDPKNPEFYTVNGVGLVLHQQNPTTLMIGGANNLVPYAAEDSSTTELSQGLQQCLESQSPFFKRDADNPFTSSSESPDGNLLKAPQLP